MRKDWIVGSVTLSAVLGGLMAAGSVRAASKNKQVEAFIPAAFALIVALVAGDAAWGMPVGPGPFPSGGPVILRLEGVIEPTPDTSKRAGGFTVASFGFLGDHSEESRWLSVTDARTVGTDIAADGKDVLEAVAPFEPNLLVAGTADVVADMQDAPPGTALRVEGLVEPGSRIYYLRSVVREGTNRR